MNKALIIGDIHLKDKHYGFLQAQINTIVRLAATDDYTTIVFLGDVFDKRRPTPSELLAFRDILDQIKAKRIYIIRGNHESETKSDNGVTVLSLFHNARKGIHVVEHTQRFTHKDFLPTTIVPHYEHPQTIIEGLESAKEGDIVFGHFGYFDFNSVHSDDISNINLDHFRNFSILGHIHVNAQIKNVVTLGTPYSTNFGEHNRNHYYGVIEYNDEGYTYLEYPMDFGIQHIVCTEGELPKYQEIINGNDYYTLVKIVSTKLEEDISQGYKDRILAEYDANYLDVVFRPVIEQTKYAEDISNYIPQRHLFKINDVIIEDYIKKNATKLSEKDIKEGYERLND